MVLLVALAESSRRQIDKDHLCSLLNKTKAYASRACMDQLLQVLAYPNMILSYWNKPTIFVCLVCVDDPKKVTQKMDKTKNEPLNNDDIHDYL